MLPLRPRMILRNAEFVHSAAGERDREAARVFGEQMSCVGNFAIGRNLACAGANDAAWEFGIAGRHQ